MSENITKKEYIKYFMLETKFMLIVVMTFLLKKKINLDKKSVIGS